MTTEQSQRTRRMDSSELQRFRSILTLQRDETMRSLDRLGDETRNADSDYPKDIGDFCETTLSKEALFQQSAERRLKMRTIEAALARIRQGTFACVWLVATTSIRGGLMLCPGLSTVFAANRASSREEEWNTDPVWLTDTTQLSTSH